MGALMSTHNIGLYEEISLIIIKYHQILTLSLLLLLTVKVNMIVMKTVLRMKASETTQIKAFLMML